MQDQGASSRARRCVRRRQWPSEQMAIKRQSIYIPSLYYTGARGAAFAGDGFHLPPPPQVQALSFSLLLIIGGSRSIHLGMQDMQFPAGLAGGLPILRKVLQCHLLERNKCRPTEESHKSIPSQTKNKMPHPTNAAVHSEAFSKKPGANHQGPRLRGIGAYLPETFFSSCNGLDLEKEKNKTTGMTSSSGR